MKIIRVIAVCGSFVFLASVFPVAEAHGPGHNPSRHHYLMRNGIPPAYEGLLNPLRRNAENLSSGETLYVQNCVARHGPTGAGDGPGAAALNPGPPALAGMYARPMQGMARSGAGGHLMHGVMHHHPGMTHARAMGGVNLDAYTFWSVSEGGRRWAAPCRRSRNRFPGSSAGRSCFVSPTDSVLTTAARKTDAFHYVNWPDRTNSKPSNPRFQLIL